MMTLSKRKRKGHRMERRKLEFEVKDLKVQRINER